MSEVWVGRAVKRVEDPKILRGKGEYVADLQFPGMVHASFVRSQHAHATIAGIHLDALRDMDGVIGGFTRHDLGNMPAVPLLVPNPALKPITEYPLSDGTARYVGEVLAVVVGENQYAAEDGAEAVSVDYTPLDCVMSARVGLSDVAPHLHPSLDDNLAAHIKQRVGDVKRVMEEAPVVVTETIFIGRAAAHPMETRGVVAQYSGGRLTVWSSTQSPHNLRRALSICLGLTEHSIHVITPDVGGGFGPKAIVYPEEIVVPWLTMRLGVPVKWIEDRREHFIATSHEREQYHEARMALDNDGHILAVEDTFWADQGAYVPWGIIVPYLTSTTVPGPYKVPNYWCDGYVVYTNKTPVAPYRGAGRPQGVTIMERLMDRAAERLNLDRAEIRFRNLIQKEDFPYEVGLIYRDGSPLTYDSGDYVTGLESALSEIGYKDFKQQQAEARAQGRYIGVGLGLYVEGTGLGPFEGAIVRIDTSGRVVVYTGSPAQGQGHKTVFAQIVAEQLGIDMQMVDVIEGDTDMIPRGIGTFASRVAAVGGSSVLGAAKEVRHQIAELASRLFEASAEDIAFENGQVFPQGVPSRAMGFHELALIANNPAPGSTQQKGVAPGLESTHYFQPKGSTYSSGVHAVVVEVDPEVGSVKILKYVVVHDCGKLLNPMLVDGQVQGGLGHGVSGALYEELVYDENGQLITGSYMDYILPTACEVPDATIIHMESPSPLNPLGVKGAGEGGTIPACAAIGSAVEDALRPFHVHISEFPLGPMRIRRAIEEATKDA